MNKTHFTVAPKPDHVYRFRAQTVCGREAVSTTSVHSVNCLNCKKQPEFVEAQVAATVAAAEAFANQTPVQVMNPWDGKPISCSCGHDRFRSNGRSLDTYNWVCAACGKTSHTMTETGMSA